MARQVELNINVTQHLFRPSHADELSAARERFGRLVSQGYLAVVKTEGGSETRQVFDPAAEESAFLFVPKHRPFWIYPLTSLLKLRDQFRSHRATGVPAVDPAELLKCWLSADQARQFEATKTFIVVGSHSGARYRIAVDAPARVVRLDQRGAFEGLHLAVGDARFPPEVGALAWKLVLEADELNLTKCQKMSESIGEYVPSLFPPG